jgi:hypothetical protein
VRGRHFLTLLAAAAYFAAGVAWLGGRAGRSERVFHAGSVYDESGKGTSLAFEYLRGRGHIATALLRDVDARLPGDGVVFRLRPQPAEPKMGRSAVTPAEQEWLTRGGRLVLGLAESYGEIAVRTAEEPAVPAKVFPVWPGVRTLRPPRHHHLHAGLPVDAVTLVAAGRETIAARWRVGRGEVVALACPEVFENAHLAAADHLRLLEALAETGRPILFDETTHGIEHPPGLMALLAEWRLGPALMLGAGALGLALWRSRARLGPPEDEQEETRSDAVDLVDSLAMLYRRALGRGQLLGLYHDALRRRASIRTGLKGPALEARLHDLMEGVMPPAADATLTHAEFARILQALNRAFDRMEDHAHTR